MHPMLKIMDMKLVTWAGLRTKLPEMAVPAGILGPEPLLVLSTLGIARNATFAVRNTVP